MSYYGVCIDCKKDKTVLHFNKKCNECWIAEDDVPKQEGVKE